MIWILYGALHGLFRAAQAETARIMRPDPWHNAFLQALFGFLLTLPFWPLMQWPQDRAFYMGAVGVSLIVSVGVLIQRALIERRTGRVSSLHMPVEAVAGFVLWIAASGTFADYLYAPAATAGILLSLMITSLALLRVRAHDGGLRVLALVVPVGLTYAVAGIVAKTIMPYSNVLNNMLPTDAVAPTALAFTCLHFAVMTVVVGLAMVVKRRAGRVLVHGQSLRAGAAAGLFAAPGFFTFVAGVTLADNPAYIAIMAMLLPVWLFLWHRVARVEDNARPVPALALVGGVVILLLATTMR